MYLLDTNILLELLLDQDNADQVERFLLSAPRENIFLSEFSLYSLGIVLLRKNLLGVFIQLVDDLLLQGGIRLARLGPEEMSILVDNVNRFGLDFDDAYQYQYTAAQLRKLSIISFDGDFDKTELGRKTPSEVMQV